MANLKIKTEHSGAKNLGGYYGTRYDAKRVSRKLRRQNAKIIIRREGENN